MKVSKEHWWDDTDGKTEVLGGKPVQMLLFPPQISHGLTQDQTGESAMGGRHI
jgi:hypothetical protein